MFWSYLNACKDVSSVWRTPDCSGPAYGWIVQKANASPLPGRHKRRFSQMRLPLPMLTIMETAPAKSWNMPLIGNTEQFALHVWLQLYWTASALSTTQAISLSTEVLYIQHALCPWASANRGVQRDKAVVGLFISFLICLQ